MNRIVRISANILKMFAGEILVKKKKKNQATITKSSILAIRIDVSTLRSVKLVNFMPPARDNGSRYRGKEREKL